jgi:VIT family/Protein of unknown function (DUF2924)
MKKGAKAERDPQKLASQLEQLRELNSDQLRERWQTLFGAEPPPKLRSSLLVQAIAYRLQERALGGLKSATLRLLERIADDAAARRQAAPPPEKIRVSAVSRPFCNAHHGLVAGSMSMAVGEYVSVSAQRDSEQADIELEQQELADEPRAELNELAMIYEKRGLEKELALKVAQELSARDRLGTHMRDELGIETKFLARPLQAAWISATSFASFATVPIAALLLAPGCVATLAAVAGNLKKP